MAVVAAFETRPGVVSVIKFAFVTVELAMSLPVTRLELTAPPLLECNTPKPSAGNVGICVALKLSASVPFVDNCKAPDASDNPVLASPTCTEGVEEDPTGKSTAPLNVPPVRSKLSEDAPVKLAVMVPAAKLPLPSRETMALAVFKGVAVVAAFLQRAVSGVAQS